MAPGFVRSFHLAITLRMIRCGEVRLISHNSNSRLVNLEVNCCPRSETTSLGSPWRRNTFLTYSAAVCSAVTSDLVGMKCAIFEKRSTQTRITSWFLDPG